MLLSFRVANHRSIHEETELSLVATELNTGTARETGVRSEGSPVSGRGAADNRERDIPKAMRAAARHGGEVALSHPSFELWLPPHFRQWTTPQDGLAAEEYDGSSGGRGKGINGRRAAPIPGPGTETYAQWTRRTGHAENRDPLKRDPPSGGVLARHAAAGARTTVATAT
ncbi:hypothetical protein [Streptomyces sp. NRRL F-5126]|uniref:hypothetical protein n=1 Tax=Streptomyces sp. NRRL F-5126 TaxID=1463857 RepID=UPI0004CB1E43|nr:hypothetical protein [Streptomyces sp. NRRL F-5126]